MNLEERLRDLCERSKRAQAESLAKAALANESVDAVTIDDTDVHVETPRFRGVHRLQTDHEGVVDVHTAGEYTFKSDLVKLSFSTISIPPQADDLVQESLDTLNDADPNDTDIRADDEPARPADFGPVELNAAVNTADPPAPLRVRFLKGLF